MKSKDFTAEYYLDMWSLILSSYQWWGHDLSALMNNIQKTNPIISESFNEVYKKVEFSYIQRATGEISKFVHKLDTLIPLKKKLYTKLCVKSLKSKNDDIAISESIMMNRIDYLIAVLCFAEEFSLLGLNSKKISSNKNILSAHSNNIDIFIEQDKKTNVTLVRILIPCELCIEYSASESPIT